MRRDLKEALMIISKDSVSEYEITKRLSVEDFLVKYKLFIQEVERKNDKVKWQTTAKK